MSLTNNMTTSSNASWFGGEVGQEAVDAAYIIMTTFIVFTMQSGFGLLESGMVSRKSESNVMVKNMLDIVIGGFGFWALGYSIAFGGSTKESNVFVGDDEYFVNADHIYELARFFLHLGYSATATTIVSGAVAERIQLSSYMIFILVQSTFTYSFPAHWVWHKEGWLNTRGMFDYAGGAVVHVTGGAACLAAALVLGPRHGRFSYDDKDSYGMACPSNVVLGTFVLWWGWIGFNCGATLGVTGGMWRLAVRAGVSTMNGAIGGGLAGIALNLVMYRKRNYILDIPQFTSSILGGLVGITASAAVIQSWHAILIGFTSGLLANGGIYLLTKLKIDDPVGCFGVHWVGGFWGMICSGFFAKAPKGFEHLMKDSGVFYGGSGKLLAYNIAGCLIISVWSGGITLAVFLVMKYTIGIRISHEKEIRGSDEVEHNIIEYIKTIETKHVFGKHVISNKKKNVQSNNGISSSQIGPNGNSVVLVLRGQKRKDAPTDASSLGQRVA